MLFTIKLPFTRIRNWKPWMCSEAMICFDVFKVILARFFCFFTVYFDRNFRLKMTNNTRRCFWDRVWRQSLSTFFDNSHYSPDSCLHIKLCLLLWLNLGNWHFLENERCFVVSFAFATSASMQLTSILTKLPHSPSTKVSQHLLAVCIIFSV